MTMEKNDNDDEQAQKKQSIIELLNIIKKNNKDSNIKEELEVIEKRIKG